MWLDDDQLQQWIDYLNNNFSGSIRGKGIGMYRSSRNKILNNNLDFNVRGYSHGIFNRGQDSADILVLSNVIIIQFLLIPATPWVEMDFSLGRTAYNG